MGVERGSNGETSLETAPVENTQQRTHLQELLPLDGLRAHGRLQRPPALLAAEKEPSTALVEEPTLTPAYGRP